MCGNGLPSTDQLRPLAADACGALVDACHTLEFLLLYMRVAHARSVLARGNSHAHSGTDTHGHRKMQTHTWEDEADTHTGEGEHAYPYSGRSRYGYSTHVTPDKGILKHGYT